MDSAPRSLIALILFLIASALAAEPAGASGAIKECGDLPSQAAYNITSRSVRCKEARRVVRGWGGRGNVTVRGLACRYRDTGYEAGDIRCTGSRGGVVRWQTGS